MRVQPVGCMGRREQNKLTSMKKLEEYLSNFHWIVEDVLGGMAMPGYSFFEPQQELEILKKMGFTTIISLTEKPIPFDIAIRHGLSPYHIPVVDFSAPTVEQSEKFCEIVDSSARKGRKSIVHCFAGLGRTGTMGAVYLMHREGLCASDAIARVRSIEPLYIQSEAQEMFLYEWEGYLEGRNNRK